MKKLESADSVISKLLSFIRVRHFEAGGRLSSERELAQRFQVGRGAVREALATLESMRIVERRPNSGIYLRNLDVDSSIEALVLQNDLGMTLNENDVREAYEMRSILEIQSMLLSCERRTDEDLEHMRVILERGDNLIQQGLTIKKEDWEFHLSIVAATKNHVFVRIVNFFYYLSESRRTIYFSNMNRCRRSMEQHWKIYEALKSQNVSLCLSSMKEHLMHGEQEWLATLASDV